MRYKTIVAKFKNVLILLVFSTSIVILITIASRHHNLLQGVNVQKPMKRTTKKQPGEFLNDIKPTNVSYCKYRYSLPSDFTYNNNDISYPQELSYGSDYKILYNVIESLYIVNGTLDTVTYVTHATIDFIEYLPEILKLWKGPVSLAVFVPNNDAEIFVKYIATLCTCMPETYKLSVHFVYPKKYPPMVEFSDKMDSSVKDDVTKLGLGCYNRFSGVSFRSMYNLAYPVNICRNVAKKAAITKYILVSDIELMPSKNMSVDFLDMVSNLKTNSRFLRNKTVYVIPVFEIDLLEDIPHTKNEIKTLASQEKAVYFHRHVCSHCQRFPGLEKWFQTKGNVKPLTLVKREFPYHRWEPIYIGTKRDPLYSELLSWEGKQDKMTQMLEMCLLGYSFVILDGVFLVHWPGIKRRISKNHLSWRTPFISKNSRQYSKIVQSLSKRHPRNPRCKV